MIMPLGRNTNAGLTRLRHFNEVEDTGLLLIDGKRWGPWSIAGSPFQRRRGAALPMMLSPYHAKYFAYDLTRRAAGGMDRLSMSLFDAAVDLNPHQIEAALFALQSPLSKGVILADEVGLGKTIEAGIVLCQFWAERKRRLLVLCPASLRKQWALELGEKFNLPTRVLDSKAFRGEQT